MCGFPKDTFYYYKAWWGPSPSLHFFPHWNWHGREGDEIPVWVYSNLEEVELLRQRRQPRRQKVPRLGHVEWNAKYEPGVIEARGYRGGTVVLTEKRETTGPAATLRLTADRTEIHADGEDLAVLKVEALDKEGRVVPIADNKIAFKVAGPGKLIGVGNGDPNCQESDKEPRRSLFNGLAQVIIQSTRRPGPIHIEAGKDGWDGSDLTSATILITAKPAEPRPSVPSSAHHDGIIAERYSQGGVQSGERGQQMDKREFLKASGAALTGSLVPRFLHAQGEPEPRTNWSGNYTYSTGNLFQPSTVEETQAIVRKCAHVRALGSRHSFNGIADSTQNQLAPVAMKSIELDDTAKTVTLGAGVRYGDLAPVIDAKGFALHNLASLPHISVAGAIATATHGSGLHNGNLATVVSAMEFVAANGQVVRLSKQRDGDKLKGASVHLGALGVLTRVTLDVQPTYQVAQTVYLDLPFSVLEHHLEDVFAAGYSVSLFTDWQKGRATQAWIKQRTDRKEPPLGSDFYGAKRATVKMHPIAGHPAEACTEQLGVPARGTSACRTSAWTSRLPAATNCRQSICCPWNTAMRQSEPWSSCATRSLRTYLSPNCAQLMPTICG